VLDLFILLIFMILFVWLLWVTRRMDENAEFRRRYPGERYLKLVRVVWSGLFCWGLFLGSLYVIFLARNAP
jgi:hypothetical protein